MSPAPVLAQLYSSSTQKWPFVSVYLVYVFNICSPAKQSFFATYRFPRVFGDEFGDELGDSLNFVSKLVTHLVMISVNHCIW